MKSSGGGRGLCRNIGSMCFLLNVTAFLLFEAFDFKTGGLCRMEVSSPVLFLDVLGFFVSHDEEKVPMQMACTEQGAPRKGGWTMRSEHGMLGNGGSQRKGQHTMKEILRARSRQRQHCR